MLIALTYEERKIHDFNMIISIDNIVENIIKLKRIVSSLECITRREPWEFQHKLLDTFALE